MSMVVWTVGGRLIGHSFAGYRPRQQMSEVVDGDGLKDATLLAYPQQHAANLAHAAVLTANGRPQP